MIAGSSRRRPSLKAFAMRGDGSMTKGPTSRAECVKEHP
jgi:hypothetical protein